ncbi:hypothetical protein H8F21_15110 [Pseudomonas sp. P66]|uniref:Uncharacterized protein n=1 Tax=Pseudomonas arcuscaelestis TaxID=2710591 RepID=A0ABS2BZ43_9PSED|nr:hypothetical protein [Pseudomonas arcuscaelestis]MBM5458894.1 hypothetical protein [Pseudomonas arcuscaelestis]
MVNETYRKADVIQDFTRPRVDIAMHDVLAVQVATLQLIAMVEQDI